MRQNKYFNLVDRKNSFFFCVTCVMAKIIPLIYARCSPSGSNRNLRLAKIGTVKQVPIFASLKFLCDPLGQHLAYIKGIMLAITPATQIKIFWTVIFKPKCRPSKYAEIVLPRNIIDIDAHKKRVKKVEIAEICCQITIRLISMISNQRCTYSLGWNLQWHDKHVTLSQV